MCRQAAIPFFTTTVTGNALGYTFSLHQPIDSALTSRASLMALVAVYPVTPNRPEAFGKGRFTLFIKPLYTTLCNNHPQQSYQ